MSFQQLWKSWLPVFLSLFLLSGCATQMNAPDTNPSGSADKQESVPGVHKDTLQKIRARGTMRVGLSVFVPWAMHNQGNELIGYEVDVAQKLAKDIGVEVEFVETSWASIITGLLKEEYDIIISGLSLTPERALLINYSQPYGHSASTIIAHRRNAQRLSTPAALNNAQVTIGVVKGSANTQRLADRYPKATLVPFDSESHAMAALLEGKLHAMVASTPRIGYLLTRYSKILFQPVQVPIATYSEGFGIRKGDSDFLAFLNTWIECTERSGWLAERRHYWFDSIAWGDQL
jgi:polar amino acid transport system substrate-binding protein